LSRKNLNVQVGKALFLRWVLNEQSPFFQEIPVFYRNLEDFSVLWEHVEDENLMKKLLWKLPALILSLLLFPFTGLQAQMICTGSACSSLPVSSDYLNQVFYSLEAQYLNEVLKDMSNAAGMAGVQLSPSGVVNLREFTLGGQMALGAAEKRKLNVYVPGYGTIEDMPSAGIAAVPRIFMGFNAGYIFSGEPRAWSTPSFLSPYRFDVYISGLNMSLSSMKEFAKPKKNEDYDGFSKSIGAEVRYHLVEGGDREAFWFAFTGVSLGLGYNRVEQKLQYVKKNSKVKLNAGSGTTVIWNGENRITYNSRMDVIPVSIRTGFQFLYLFRLSVGGGVAWTKGSSNLELRRFGRAYASNDYAALLGITLPDAYLDLRLKGKGGPDRPSQAFATLGLEINIPFIKLFVDAAGNREVYSASAGVRMAF
jgi:hypothetical protein